MVTIFKDRKDARPLLTISIKALEKYISKQMKSWNTPGLAVGIVKEDELIYAKGFGVRDIDQKDPVNEQTLFQIGSITKSFTTSLMAQLVDAKKLHWHDRVIDLLPDFKLHDDEVTRDLRIEDLSVHRSGLPFVAGTDLFAFGFSRKQVMQSLRAIPLVNPFRSEFAYQNNLLLVEAAIAEKCLHHSWEYLIQQKFFDPLHMKNSSVTLKDYLGCENHAAFHIIDRNNHVERLDDQNPYVKIPYLLGPAGGINSNVIDLSTWLLLHMRQGTYDSKPFIEEKTVQYMQRPRLYAYQQVYNYYSALSWFLCEYKPYPIILHGGCTLGARSFLAFIPQEKLGIVVLSNSVSLLAELVGFYFFDQYYKNDSKPLEKILSTMQENGVHWEYQPEADQLQPSWNMKQFDGKYHHSLLGDAVIDIQGKQKWLKFLNTSLLDGSSELVLKPWKHNIYSIIFPKIDEQGLSKIVFFKNRQGIKQIILYMHFNTYDFKVVFHQLAE
jgi:CubicO group peptidase (beta-lactamase class C family)